MGLKAKGPGLKRLARLIEQAPQMIRSEAARGIQKGIEGLIKDEFRSKTDPYGAAWKPPKDGGKTMDRTGRLKRGFDVVASPTGEGISIRVTNEQEYAHWLQDGTRRMEPRRMVPMGGSLPDKWDKVFAEAYKAAFLKWFSKLGLGN